MNTVGEDAAPAPVTSDVDAFNLSTPPRVSVAVKPCATEEPQRFAGDVYGGDVLLLAKQKKGQGKELVARIAASASLLAGPERVAADIMRDGVLDYITTCDRGRLGLFSVTLTIANVNTDIEACAAELGTFIVKGAAGQGAYLVIDVSRRDREHLHGLVIAEDPRAVVLRWCALTSSEESAQRLVRLSFSKRAWDLSVNPKLAKHVDRVLWYATKLSFPSASPLTGRVVAACGAVYGPWKRARAAVVALGQAAATSSGMGPTRRSYHLTCERCQRMFESRRPQAKTCSGSCRTLLSRARRMDALVPTPELKAVYAVVQCQPKVSLMAIAARTQLPLEHVRRALWELDDRGAALGGTR